MRLDSVVKVSAALLAAGVVAASLSAPRESIADDGPAPVGSGSTSAEHVGSKKCKKCHRKQHKSWEETRMAKAFAILAPGAAAEAKTKGGLDPQKDYRADPKCLECHTVGFGHKGGFAVGYDTEKDPVQLLGVGCESCHGPGGAFLGDGRHDKEYKDEAVRKQREPELIAAGFVAKPDAEACRRCHNEKSPTFTEFDFEKRKQEGLHKTGDKTGD